MAITRERPPELDTPQRPAGPLSLARWFDDLLNHGVAGPLSSERAGVCSGESPETPVPAWARETFKALPFQIGRYRFAAPLVSLRGITKPPPSLHRLPGQPGWHRGLFEYRGLTVVVADAGLLLGFEGPCSDPAYLVVIGDGREAFGCDAIDDTLTVEPQAVRWRGKTAENDWLPGHLAAEMAGLMDTDAIRKRFRHE